MKEDKLFNIFAFTFLIGIAIFVSLIIIKSILEFNNVVGNWYNILLIITAIDIGCIIVGMFGLVIPILKVVTPILKEKPKIKKEIDNA